MNEHTGEKCFPHQPFFLWGEVDFILQLSRLECCLQIDFKIRYQISGRVRHRTVSKNRDCDPDSLGSNPGSVFS